MRRRTEKPFHHRRPTAFSGYTIRFLRIQRALTQSQLACMLGISPVQLSRFERGERPIPESISAQLRSWDGAPVPKDRGADIDHTLHCALPF